MARVLRNPFETTPDDLPGGLRFERLVTSYLSDRLSNKYIIIPNVIVDNSRGGGAGSGALTRREIDHVVVGPNGLFLLEAKNYHGSVDGLLWGHWDVTRVDRDGVPLPYRQRSERREAVALEERMYRVSALVEKYINKTGLRSLTPFIKVRGVFVFPESTSVNLLAKDSTPANPRADVRALTLDAVVASIETEPLPRRAQAILKDQVLRLAEVVDRGLDASLGSPHTTGKVIGHYQLEREIHKDQAPNGLNFTVYSVLDLNTGIHHRGKYYDWAPMDKNAQAVWNGQVQRHQTALSALSSNRHIHQIITALRDDEGHGYLVVEGSMNYPSLNELLNDPQGLKRLDTDRFMLNLALGVRAVHKHRFIHRELSPKSVFVDVEGDAAIITSFELAKMLADEAAAQKEIPTVFTRRVALNSYRAPEIEISPHDVSYTADIYSWGAIYFRLITGHQFRNEPKAFARLAATNCKQAVISLVEKCLEADPSDRPRDMEEVITSVRENLTYRRDVEI